MFLVSVYRRKKNSDDTVSDDTVSDDAVSDSRSVHSDDRFEAHVTHSSPGNIAPYPCVEDEQTDIERDLPHLPQLYKNFPFNPLHIGSKARSWAPSIVSLPTAHYQQTRVTKGFMWLQQRYNRKSFLQQEIINNNAQWKGKKKKK